MEKLDEKWAMIIGTLNEEPHIYTTVKGKSAATLEVATVRLHGSGRGIQKYSYHFHHIFAYGSVVEDCISSLKKGIEYAWKVHGKRWKSQLK